MMNVINEISQRKIAIIAGIAFLIMTVAAGFSYGFVLGNLVVPGDAAATANKITASGLLFRSAIFGFLVILVCDVVVAWALYVFLSQTSKSFSLLMALLRLVYVVFLGIAILNLVFVMLISGGEDYPRVFEASQMNALILFFIDAFNDIWAIGLIVFGLHLLILGYLVFKSGYIPGILGVFLMIAAFSYMSTNLANMLLPDYKNYKETIEMVLGLPMAIGELSLALWLLIKGGR